MRLSPAAITCTRLSSGGGSVGGSVVGSVVGAAVVGGALIFSITDSPDLPTVLTEQPVQVIIKAAKAAHTAALLIPSFIKSPFLF